MVDVAAAIVAALKDDGSSMGKTYELGGPDVFTTHELVNSFNPSFSLCHCASSVGLISKCVLQAEIMYDMIREWPRYVKLPFPIAKVKRSNVHCLW